MAVWYLDTDDEITDAVARLRAATDEHVVFVVPPGSRIATGRINFKLLAREARARDLELAVVSRDDQVRALATAAGVIARASVADATAALERGEPPPAASDGTPDVDDTGDPGAGAAASDRGEGRALRWSGPWMRVSVMVVLSLAVVGAFVGWQVLPTASITLRPHVVPLGPLEAEVTALREVSEPDVASGEVPAVALSVPLSVEGTFAASGTEAVEARATGHVIFTSPQQPNAQEIPEGTRVETAGGIEFQTTQTVTLPPTEDAPSEVRAPIEAVRSGDEGNVAAGAITIVPSLEGAGISVANPGPTTGGRFEQSARITAEDYDSAAVDLQNRLAAALVAYLRDPANTPPDVTLFPGTAQLGRVRFAPTAEEVLGRAATEFSLEGSATAEVLAVDERQVDEVVRQRLLDTLPEGSELLPGSLLVGHDKGSAEGQRVEFSGRASAQSYPRLDADVIREQVAGLPVSEARAILEGFGTATVEVWPDFLDGLPADRERITLTVMEPSTTE